MSRSLFPSFKHTGPTYFNSAQTNPFKPTLLNMLNFPPISRLHTGQCFFSPPKLTLRKFAGNKSLLHSPKLTPWKILLGKILSSGRPAYFQGLQVRLFGGFYILYIYMYIYIYTFRGKTFLATSGKNHLRSLWHSITLVGSWLIGILT